MFNITNGHRRLLRRPPLRRPLRFHRTRRPQSQTSLARCCSPRQQRQHPQVRRVQDGEQQVLYEQQMQDQQQVHSPSKQRRTSHTQQPLTGGAELAPCRHAQQPTYCAPSRSRRNSNACAQDTMHTHTAGIDAAREGLPGAPPQRDRRWHRQRHASRIPLPPPRSTACTTAWCRTYFDASSGTWCTARAIAAVST